MASCPITSWQIDRETMETVTDFIFLGFKITVECDCSHEIKRHLLFGRKAMTNLDSILKSRDMTLPTKVHLSSHVWMWELDHKEGWALKNWCLKLLLEMVFLLLFSHSVVSYCLGPHALQHTRLPCSSPSPKACSNSCPLRWWCHPTISFSVAPFSCPQSFPVSRSFPMSWLFASGGQSFRTSASVSVFPLNI